MNQIYDAISGGICIDAWDNGTIDVRMGQEIVELTTSDALELIEALEAAIAAVSAD